MKRTGRKLLSLLMAAAMVTGLCAMTAGAAQTVATEQELISAVVAGGEVNLDADITVSATVSTGEAVTINGGSHTLTYTGTDAAIAATSNNLMTVNNLKIVAEAAGADGISLSGTAPKLTVSGCTLTVNDKGVNDFPADYSNLGTGAAISVLNSTIQCSRLPVGQSYETWATVGDTRGLSLTDLKAAAVTVENSVIQGFGYSININGHKDSTGISDMQNTVFTIKDSTIRGWTALNIWSVNATFNVTNSHLIGINVATSGQNGFSTIALNNGIYGSVTDKPNVFYIKGGSIEAYKYSSYADIDEHLIRVEAEGQSEFTFSRYNRQPVNLYTHNDTQPCIFMTAYPGMSDQQLIAWFNAKVTGATDTNCTHNIPFVPVLNALSEDDPPVMHEGGFVS